MVDYIRGYFTNKYEVESHFKKNHRGLVLKSIYNYNNQRTEYPLKTFLDNISIKFTQTMGCIENSLHKKFNEINGKDSQNYNDFYYCDLLDTLNVIESETACQLSNISLTQLEFGFNIDLGINPTKILEENILMYGLRSPCSDPKNFKNKKIKKFTYHNYEIKIYNKSLQYGLTGVIENLLRIEVKYKTKKEFNKFGIYCLEDLKNPNKLNNMFIDFLKKFDEILIIDSFDGNSSMKKEEVQFITKCTHPNFWIHLGNNFHRNTKSKNERKMNKLISKYNLDNWKKDIRSLILDKYNELLKVDCNEREEDFKKCA